ncbi:MAG: hypothetical protein ABI054_06405, partial [Planctomycetota bacterium]
RRSQTIRIARGQACAEVTAQQASRRSAAAFPPDKATTRASPKAMPIPIRPAAGVREGRAAGAERSGFPEEKSLQGKDGLSRFVPRLNYAVLPIFGFKPLD